MFLQDQVVDAGIMKSLQATSWSLLPSQQKRTDMKRFSLGGGLLCKYSDCQLFNFANAMKSSFARKSLDTELSLLSAALSSAIKRKNLQWYGGSVRWGVGCQGGVL